MWDEKRLIWFAGPGGGPPEGPGAQPPDGRKDGREGLREDTGGKLNRHEEDVASDVVKTPEVSEALEEECPFESVRDFEKRFEDLRSGFSSLEKLGLKERAEVIINLRRKIMEIGFLINYLRRTEFIEIIDGYEIYSENEKSKIDLSAAKEELLKIERELLEIKAEDKQKEVYLYRDLEKTRDTIKPKDFLKLPLADRLKLVSNIKSWDDLKDEALVVFNFGKNRALEYQIGLGDLMPPEIRKIALGGSVFGRRANQGFYHNSRYLAIFNGSKVKIVERDKDYASKNEVEYAKRFGNSYVDKKSSPVAVLDVAKNFGVDAYFLEAVLSVIPGDGANGISDKDEFLHIAARYIQNAEMRFGGGVNDGDHYSVNFIAHALDRFNLFAEYGGRSAYFDAVADKYAALRGFKIEQREKEAVQKQREAARPRTMREVEAAGGRSKYKGEIAYEPVDISRGNEEMKRRMNERLQALKAELASRGVPERYHTAVLAKARAAYEMMIARMGTAYKSTVGIRRPDGKMWSITNNCVGHAMKVMEGTGIRVMRGRQAGKDAANFYWGTYGDGGRDFVHYAWLRTMIPDDSYLVTEHVTPENCDELVGRHLAAGECAPAGLWNHALWIYKDVNGVVMICHSGADVRPARMKAEGEIPPGYKQSGGWYIKQRGSKVNECPLSYFLAKRQSNYAPPKNGLRFVPLTKLFMGQIEGAAVA